MLCTGLGDGVGAGGVVGGASVGEAGALLGRGAAAGWVDGAGLLGRGVAEAFLCGCRGLGVAAGRVEAAGVGVLAGRRVVWLLVVWAGAVRANSTANAAAVIALSWVARQVSRESRRSPSARPPAAGASSHLV